MLTLVSAQAEILDVASRSSAVTDSKKSLDPRLRGDDEQRQRQQPKLAPRSLILSLSKDAGMTSKGKSKVAGSLVSRDDAQRRKQSRWIPACAGMTSKGESKVAGSPLAHPELVEGRGDDEQRQKQSSGIPALLPAVLPRRYSRPLLRHSREGGNPATLLCLQGVRVPSGESETKVRWIPGFAGIRAKAKSKVAESPPSRG